MWMNRAPKRLHTIRPYIQMDVTKQLQDKKTEKFDSEYT